MPRFLSITAAAGVAALSLATLACADLFDPPVPTTLEPVSIEGLTAEVGTAVTDTPAVRVLDQDGDPMEDVDVTFSITAGGGSVVQTEATTDGNGVATSGGWTLGTTAGENVLTGSAPELTPVTFTATGTPGPPATLEKVRGDGQTAEVATELPTVPQVRVEDQFGNAVPDVGVTFRVVAGGGSVSGGNVQTDANGVASPNGWTLGTAAGNNVLAAQISGLTANFTATGTPGPLAALAKAAGDGQSAVTGSAVGVPPAARAQDTHGNAISGVQVTFSVASGGGSITGATATTGSNGVASVGSWTLGSSTGTNTLRARTSGAADITFTATATAAAAFDIAVVIVGTMSASQRDAFTSAAARWEEVIVGDIPNFSGTLSAGECDLPQDLNGVDDVVIIAEIREIDGPGGTLGQAGPCFIRSGAGAPLPLTGRMEFDEDDVADLERAGAFRDVILHEMGHVLGIGTLWDVEPLDLLSGAGGSDPFFTGAGARAAFDAAGGSARTGNRVPVENTGGQGTRDGHWRESVHDNELMTGFLNLSSNPLSAITIESLRDMGYVVDVTVADPYTVPFPTASLRALAPGATLRLEMTRPTPIPAPAGGSPAGPRERDPES